MKPFLNLVFTLFIAATLVSPAIAQHKKQTKTETKMMVIKGNQDWKNTGFLIRPGDKVVFTCSGRVFFSDGNQLSGVSPRGMNRDEYEANWPLDYLECRDPIELANHASLICKIGNEKLPVGLSKTISGKKGTLSIGINDCTFEGKLKNTGEFNVNIKIFRVQ